jgi:hypothetical protein
LFSQGTTFDAKPVGEKIVMQRPAFLIVMAGLLTATMSVAQAQSTSGNCSPIVANIRGNVTISCTLLANRIPVYKFQGGITHANVKEFGEFVEAHKDDIIELDISPDFAQARGSNPLYFVTQSQGRMLLALQAPNNPKATMDGGMAYNIISTRNITWANGAYEIRGFYSIESIPGIHQGWMEIALEEIPRGELLARGRVDRR